MPPPKKATTLVHWLGDKPRKLRRRHQFEPNKSPGPIGEILASIEPGNNAKDNPIDQLSREIWLSAVGERIATRSQPDKLNPDGVLMVRVSTSVWAQELSLLSSVILRRLGALGWHVRYLRFFVGPLERSVRMPARYEKRVVPPPAGLPEALCQDLAKVEDVELRDAIARAASASFAAERAERILQMTPKQLAQSKKT